MKLFSCKVRLKGNALDEVRKTNVTSAEITLLNVAHDVDDVVYVGEADRSAAQERDRLEAVYGERAVLSVFGAPKAAITDEIETDNAEPAPRKARRSRETVETSDMAAAAFAASAASADAALA